MCCKKIFIFEFISLIILLSASGCNPTGQTPAKETNPFVTSSPNVTIPSPSALTQPDPLTDVVVNADLIVLGTITDFEYRVVDVGQGDRAGKFAYTIFTLSVEKVMKGDPGTKEAFIKVEGGKIDDQVMQGPTGWYFSIKDRVLVCLNREEGDVYTVPYIYGVPWIEGVNVHTKPGLQEMMGHVAKIMKSHNIPIALDEPIPIPIGPVRLPEN